MGGYILSWDGGAKVLPRTPGAASSFPELVSLLCRELWCWLLPQCPLCCSPGATPSHGTPSVASRGPGSRCPAAGLGPASGDTRAVPVPVHGDTGLVPQVRDWTENESSNQGLLVTVQGRGGSPLDPPPLQFASGRGHHESKKPMLVLFTDDGRRGASLPTAGFPGGSHVPGTAPSVPTCLSQGVLPTRGLLKSKPPSLAGGRGSLLSGVACSGVLLACRCEAGFEGGHETEGVTSWWLCLGW